MNQQLNTSPTSSMTLLNGVVTLGKRQYAVSLLWSLAENNKKLLQEAKIAAVRMGSTILALRPGNGLWNDQFAIGDLSLGHKPKLRSLAAALAENFDGSLLGVWLFDNNVFWLVGIRSDGSITYDRAVADADEIRIEFINALKTGYWDRIVCPASFNIDTSEVCRPLNEIIGSGKVRLRSLKKNFISYFLRIMIIMFFSTAIFFGYQKYKIYSDEKKLSDTSFNTNNIPPSPVMPWVDKIQGVAALNACVKGIIFYSDEATKIPGWSRGIGRCDGSSITYSVTSTGGTKKWLNIMAARLQNKPTVIDSEKESFITWELHSLPTYKSDSPGISIKKVQKYLQSEFDELFTPIQFIPGRQELYWNSINYKLVNISNPNVYLPLFAKIPALLLQEVTFEPHSNFWTFSGEIYERLQPTQQQIENSNK